MPSPLQARHMQCTLKLTRPVSALAAHKVVRRMCAAHSSAGGQRFALPNNTHLVMQQGDITKWSGDAIVNAGIPTSLLLSCSVRARHMRCCVQTACACMLDKTERYSSALDWKPHAQCLNDQSWVPPKVNCAPDAPLTCVCAHCCAANERMLGGGGVDGGERLRLRTARLCWCWGSYLT